MEQVISQLQALNTTYSQLLSTITAQQQHLKLLIHILQTNDAEISNPFIEEAINGFILSYQNLGNIINNPVYYNTREGNTTKQTVYSNVETGDGILQANHSNAETNIETLQTIYSNTETNNGISQMKHSNTEESIATKQIFYSNTKTSIPTKQIIDLKIDAEKVNASILQTKIKNYIITCSEKTAQAAAAIIIALYKEPKQTHSNLIKLSGLSIGGLAKHIMMLKKRGFIVKTAHQQFEPTSLSLQMMSECCAS